MRVVYLNLYPDMSAFYPTFDQIGHVFATAKLAEERAAPEAIAVAVPVTLPDAL